MLLTILLCVFAFASLTFSFLTLACIARLTLDHRQATDAIIDSNNVVVKRLNDLDETIDHVLDSLLALDDEASYAARHKDCDHYKGLSE